MRKMNFGLFCLLLALTSNLVKGKSFTDEEILKHCDGVNPRNITFNKTAPIIDYVRENLDINEKTYEFFEKIILYNGKVEISKIPTSLYVFAFFAAMIPVVAITWILFWACCCCNCGCFKQKDGSGCGKFLIFIITVGIFTGVCIASISSFATSSNFSDDIDGLTCYFGKFFIHTKNGEESKEKPRWIGTNEISNMVKNAYEQIEIIEKDNTTLNDDNFNHLNESQDKYYSKGKELLNISLYTKLKSPNPSNPSKNVTPTYAEQFSNPNDTTQYIGKIFQDYIQNISIPVGILGAFKDNKDSLKQNFSSLFTTLDHVEEQAKKMTDTVNTIQNTAFEYISEFKSTVKEKSYLFFKILFGMFIGFSILIVVNLILYSCSRCWIFKFLIHIIWNLLLIFIILSFVIAIIFGVLYQASIQLAPLSATFLKAEYLNDNPFFTIDSEPAKLIDTCVNQNGDLATALNISQNVSSEITELYTIVNNLTETLNNIEGHNNSEVLEEVVNDFQKYKNDFSLVTNSTNGDDDVTKNLNELNKLTDEDEEECQTHDYYVSNIKYCKKDYNNITSPKDYKENEPNCIILQGNEEDLEYIEKYNCSHKVKIEEKIKQLQSFIIDSNLEIENINSSFDDLKNRSPVLLKELEELIRNTVHLTSGLLDVFKDIMNADGFDFNAIFNCNFIKVDLVSFIDIIAKDFKKDCLQICVCTTVAAFLSYVGLFFLMVSIYKHKKLVERNGDYSVLK